MSKNKSELEIYSADTVQLYGAFVGSDEPGCQDYTKPFKLNGVRIVDVEWLLRVLTERDVALAKLAELGESTSGAEALKAENLRLKTRVSELRHFAGEIYQVLGALNAPENVLDNASDAANGIPLRHESLLPFCIPESEDSRRIEVLLAELSGLRQKTLNAQRHALDMGDKAYAAQARVDELERQEPVAWTWQGTIDRLRRGDYLPEGVTVFSHKGPGVPSPLYAAPVAHTVPVPNVFAMARVFSDRIADEGTVDREDHWKLYGNDFIEHVKAMLAVAHQPAEGE